VDLLQTFWQFGEMPLSGTARKASEVCFEEDREDAKKRFRNDYDSQRLGKRCNYSMGLKLGGGSFGELYLGHGPSNEKVAIKVEKHDQNCKHLSTQLRHEYKVYRELANCKGFCSIYFYGSIKDHNVLVMDLLQTSLEDKFHQRGKCFTLKTILQIADQLLERIETLHSRHLIHRDIKPANFVLGREDMNQDKTIFAVDFGLSKRYRDPETKNHIYVRRGRPLTGTPRYASINSHHGFEQSRRDDLESIAYVLIYFLKGSLPWQGMQAETPQIKYRMIRDIKVKTTVSDLCSGLPSVFAEFLIYTRGLRFDQNPDYEGWRAKFSALYKTLEGFDPKKYWDWSAVSP